MLHALRIHVNRRLIGRNLYAITPCLRQMLSLWQTTYTKLSFVNADALLSHAGAFDLVEFIVSNHPKNVKIMRHASVFITCAL